MRISKNALYRGWAWTTGAGLLVFAVLAISDLQLKAATGVGTADLQGLVSAAQIRAAFWAWTEQSYAFRAGFNLGFDFVLIPLYAVSFYFSGLIAAEHFTLRGSRLQRLIVMAAMAGPVAALCDVAENVIQLTMMLGGPTDTVARIAAMASNAKYAAMLVGLVLVAGAVVARVAARKKVAV